MQINLLKMCCFILVLNQICEIRIVLLFHYYIATHQVTYHTKQYTFQVSFILNSLVHILKVTAHL